MIKAIFKHFAGRHYKKFLKKCQPVVEKIKLWETEYKTLAPEQLREKTEAFKQRYREGESLEDLLPEAFAVVKSAAKQLVGTKYMLCGHELMWDMVHYDVQLIGGIALHEGKICEMATGEGKTLVATLPFYLNALTGKNCQLATVNDYLARRDAQQMGYIYEMLGLKVACIQHGMNTEERKAAYTADITYGTASEFGFDYLRDNGMATSKEEQVQREHYFAIIDEADSILIDEARTPLIISGTSDASREAPFSELRPSVERLVRVQQQLCNRLVTEAKESLDKDLENALPKLLQVKLGMPKNRQFLRLMEEGPARKAFDRFETEMHGESNRDRFFELKEQLFFVIEEKHSVADLTELGRKELCPNDADAFLLPDLPTFFSEVDGSSIPDKQKIEKKQEAEAIFAEKSERIHCLSQLLRAYCLYEKDDEYIVQDGKIIIIDENTGRAMPGRRWSEGLHQAVEAKEGVVIEKESKTYATITLQNYFRMYEKLSGMTGTAETEAQEFYDIYKLHVVSIPTYKPCIRKDSHDLVYKTRRDKYNAVVKKIEDAFKRGQPVLVGTASVEASELLSKMLKRVNIPHTVLNAKYHEKEADIIALAGQRSSVTISTNMAGRGTDIRLGAGIADVGGLFVVGTERHEARRIDRQLRGRCSRQGDPGMSQFFVSLEDDLMRLFANAGILSRALDKSFEEGEELTHPLVSRAIETAQKRVEQQNYSIRKRLLQYDDVLNRQREVIYALRNDILHTDEPKTVLFEMIEEELAERIEELDLDKRVAQEALVNFVQWLNMHFPVSVKVDEVAKLDEAALLAFLMEKIRKAYVAKESVEEIDALKQLERYGLIRAIDNHWQTHLTEMEELRRSVSLRSYGQKDPLNEYKSEAYGFFEELMRRIRKEICLNTFRSATSFDKFKSILLQISKNMKLSGPSDSANQSGPSHPVSSPIPNKTIQLPKIDFPKQPKIGRNDPCPCGSNKKYKKCCGQFED
ncbi:MAG: preprotein translocase subunit SecA [Verrucomicrobia bacterium GWF2_51_19]|nr:MAG: preprotein translocase subunit SecA [Verrucomicrobia bacterium GWF2_51_19]HCJ12413.1 preprotein translocase subunit SecA [Opitutae bacterium]